MAKLFAARQRRLQEIRFTAEPACRTSQGQLRHAVNCPRPLGLWLPIDHEKHDCRKARDGKKDSDLSPFHLPIVGDMEVRCLDQIAARLIDARQATGLAAHLRLVLAA